MRMETADWTSENIEKIGELFPNVITEARGEDGELKKAINFEALRQVLSEDLLEGDEAFEFTWVGKKAAMVEAGKPIRKTLRPCKEESKDWDNTENLYIEGDNLDVLKLLQESYLGKVKMIYIDPPYNTGNDFIYNDSFVMDKEDYQEQTGLFDEDEHKNFIENTDSNPRFHSDWCSMMYPRLQLARNLLSDDGVIIISIDDNEIDNLKKICDETLGSQNLVGILIHQRAKGGGQAKHIVRGHDYILIYAKNINNVELSRPKIVQQKTYEINGETYIKNDDVVRKVFGKYDKSLGDRRCFYEELSIYKSQDKIDEIEQKISTGEYFLEKNKEGFHVICRYEKLADSRSKLYSIIKVLSEEGKKDVDRLNIPFTYPKPTELISQLVNTSTDKNLIILDFFSGSATTAHAVMQLNAEDGGKRKFIMVQLPEVTAPDSEAYKAGYKNICEIGKERIRRAGEKIKAEIESNTAQLKLGEEPTHVPDIGFRVLKLDESNMKDVYYIPGAYSQTILESLESNIKADRSDLDLLFGCLLEWGLPLSMPYTSEQIDGFAVHTYNEGDLIACFDENISEKAIKEIAKRQPLRVVFRDSSFASSPEKINVEEIFKLLAPNTSVRVL